MNSNLDSRPLLQLKEPRKGIKMNNSKIGTAETGVRDEERFEQVQEVLAKMVQADYLLDKPCKICECKEGFCFNIYCIPCQTGGLCSSLFYASTSPHFNHDKIQIFKTSYQYVVRDVEMRSYFDTRLIQKYNSNNTKCCYLRTKQSEAQPSPCTSHSRRRSICQGCLKLFTLPRDSMSNPGVVCSVECLLKYNHKNYREKPVSYRYRPRKQSNPTRSPVA